MPALSGIGDWITGIARAIAGRTRSGDPTAFNDPTFAWPDRLKRLVSGDIDGAPSWHPWVFRAVKTIVDQCAGVDFDLHDGSEADPQSVESGPWYDLFLSPCPNLTRRELWTLTAHYYLGGGAYWVLYGRLDLVRSETEIPTEIQVWPASMVTPRKVDGRLDHYELRLDRGERVRLEPWQVVALRIVDPADPLRGLDMMRPARMAVETDAAAAAWNKALLDNDATPGGVLSSEQDVTTEQATAMRKAWRALHGGPDRHGDIAVLGTGLKFAATSITPKDMGFIDARRWSKDEIAAVYGVPMTYLGDMTEIHSKESARQVRKMFWEQTILPILSTWEDILEARLFAPRGSVWGAFDLSDVEALQEEVDARIANAVAARALGVPRNELNRRFDLGFELDDGLGDMALVPAGLYPLEALEADLTDMLAPLAPVPPALAAPADPAAPAADNTTDPAQDPPARSFAVRTSRRAAEREATWRAYVQQLRPYESRYAKTVRGFWRRLRSDTLDAVAKLAEGRSLVSISTRDLTEGEIGQWLAAQREKWDANLRERTAPIEHDVAESSLGRLESQLGQGLTVVDMTHPAVLQVLADRGGKKILVVDTVQQGIRRTLLEGLAAQETLPDLQDRVRKLFKVANARTMSIARTETAAAATGAKYAGMKAEGVPRHSWLSSGDDNVRDSHQIDGETVDVGATFSNGLLYPLDPAGPPEEVIQCNCEALPEG